MNAGLALSGKGPRAEQWANQICAQLSKSAEAIIATGRLLVKAKADLAHGEWARMFEDALVPFSQDVASRFMKIANHPTLSKSVHAPSLPPSWTALYELTKVPDKALDNAFRDGLITPSMERKQVKALMPVARSESTQSERAEKSEPEPDPEPEAPAQDYTGHQTARRTPTAPSFGMQMARIAIMKLKEIRDDDLERTQAFDHVRSWLDARKT